MHGQKLTIRSGTAELCALGLLSKAGEAVVPLRWQGYDMRQCADIFSIMRTNCMQHICTQKHTHKHNCTYKHIYRCMLTYMHICIYTDITLMHPHKQTNSHITFKPQDIKKISGNMRISLHYIPIKFFINSGLFQSEFYFFNLFDLI